MKQNGLYGAMHKYGFENFFMEKITECPIEDLNEMEQFYIKKYDTYNNGYNLTLGGDGTKTLDLDEREVINKYKECGFITDTSVFFGCSEPVISNILHKNNIEIKTKTKFDITTVPRSPKADLSNSKMIKIVELDKEFNSIIECGKWLILNNYCNTEKPSLAQRSVSRVLNGDRKTYCKFHFEYL